MPGRAALTLEGQIEGVQIGFGDRPKFQTIGHHCRFSSAVVSGGVNRKVPGRCSVGPDSRSECIEGVFDAAAFRDHAPEEGDQVARRFAQEHGQFVLCDVEGECRARSC